jgi:hypothetical protein
MNNLISNIHEFLRNGDVNLALDTLYLLCKDHAKHHLEEVVSQIARLKLINSSDRAGILEFEERIRLEAKVSSSILKLLNIIEKKSSENSYNETIEELRENLEIEKRKSIEAKSRLSELENSFNKNVNLANSKLIRDHLNGEKVECEIIAISPSVTTKDNYAVILKEIEGLYRLPIIIGSYEAQAIAVSMEKMIPNRPLTHDLTKNIIESLNFIVKSVIIDYVENGIFYSKIELINKNQYLEIDSRTSDAIAIALRFKAPIFTYKSILEIAGVILENDD